MIGALIKNSEFKELWSGNKTYSGTLTMAESVITFDVLLVKVKSNYQYMTGIIVRPEASQELACIFAVPNSMGQQTEPFYYKGTLQIVPSSNGLSVDVSTSYNNGNLQFGVVAIYGIRF